MGNTRVDTTTITYVIICAAVLVCILTTTVSIFSYAVGCSYVPNNAYIALTTFDATLSATNASVPYTSFIASILRSFDASSAKLGRLAWEFRCRIDSSDTNWRFRYYMHGSFFYEKVKEADGVCLPSYMCWIRDRVEHRRLPSA